MEIFLRDTGGHRREPHTLERIGDVIRFHPRLLDFAGHYHFEPVPCAKARGNEKGRVERSIRYLRESFFAARRYRDLADLNAQLDEWVETVADARVMRDDEAQRPVSDVFAEERDRLMPLPMNRFEVRLVKPVRSGKTPYVRFDRNDYSIPHTLIRKPLTLIASETEVRIPDGSDEVATHARSWERRRQVENSAHLDALVLSGLRLTAIPVAMVGFVALWRAATRSDPPATAFLLPAVCFLAASLLAGMAPWGAGLGLAACGAAPLFARRSAAAPVAEPLGDDRTP